MLLWVFRFHDCFVIVLLYGYLQVKTGSVGLIHDDISMFESGKLKKKKNSKSQKGINTFYKS